MLFRSGLLIITGHTDREGPSHVNQVESLQRALTVRQYFINELGFDSSRIVSLGMGEDEIRDPSFVAGQRNTNRRLEFQVVSQ